MRHSSTLIALAAATRHHNEAMERAQSGGVALVIETRRAMGLSQPALAVLLDCGAHYISKIENGHQPPSRRFLELLAAVWEERGGDVAE